MDFAKLPTNQKCRAGADDNAQQLRHLLQARVAHCTFLCHVSNFRHCIHKYWMLLTLPGVLDNLPLTVTVSACPVSGHQDQSNSQDKQIVTLSKPVTQKTASVSEKVELELLFSCSRCTGTVSVLLNSHNTMQPYDAIHNFSLSSPFLVTF